MQPYYYVMIGVALAIIGVVLITFRNEIRFRYHFGIRSRERGAGRIVISVLQAQIAAVENASDAAMRAKEKFDASPTLVAPLRAHAAALKKAEQQAYSCRRYFKRLCDLATKLDLGSYVSTVKDSHKREISELRLAA